MLADPRAESLATNFGAQWLQTRKVAEFVPDPVLFRRATRISTTHLRRSAAVREERAARRPQRARYLSSNETFVNERLALHYGSAACAATNSAE
jgi:hypothetical protein